MVVRIPIARAILAGLVCVVGAAAPLHAATINWGNTGTQFSTGTNWVGGTAPANNITTDIGAFTNATVVANPQLTASRSINGLVFASGTAAWTFSASAAGGDDTLTLGTGGIVNNSTNTQTFSNADLRIQLGADTAFSGAAGSILIDSTVDRVQLAGFDLTLDGAVGGSIAADIRGTGNLIKAGAGTWTLSDANTYTGTTSIGSAGGANAGTLSLGANNVLPDTAVNVFGGTLDVNTRTDTIGALALGGGASGSTAQVTIGTGGVLTLGGDVTYSAANNPNGATISGAGTLALGANRTFSVGDSSAAADDLNVSAVISGAFGITKTGAGTLTLTGSNTYSGTNTITAGTVRVGANTNLGSGAVLLNGGTLATTNTMTLTAGRNLSFGAAGGTLDVAAGTVFNYDGIITGTGKLTKTGTGTFQTGGGAQNTHTGDVDILAGTFQITKAGFFGGIDNAADVLVATGATLSMNGNAAYTQETIGPLSGGGTVINEGAAAVNFRIDTATNTTFSGTLTDTANNLNVFKLGTGTQVLSGNNSYDGVTVISNGVLQIGAGGTTGTLGTGNVTNQAGLVINRAGTYTISNTIAGTGGLTNTGTGTGTLGGTNANTYTGNTTAAGGTLVLAKPAGINAIAGGSITVTNGAVLELGASNQIANTVPLTLAGGTFRTGTSTTGFAETLGTLTLSANSTIDLGSWTGGAGTRNINFADSSAVTWGTGTLTITNWTQLTNSLSGAYGRIYFGNTAGGLTAGQLAQIKFDIGGTLYGAQLLSDGELVPIPEPRVYAAAAALLLAAGWRERRRLLGLLRRR